MANKQIAWIVGEIKAIADCSSCFVVLFSSAPQLKLG